MESLPSYFCGRWVGCFYACLAQNPDGIRCRPLLDRRP